MLFRFLMVCRVSEFAVSAGILQCFLALERSARFANSQFSWGFYFVFSPLNGVILDTVSRFWRFSGVILATASRFWRFSDVLLATV